METSAQKSGLPSALFIDKPRKLEDKLNQSVKIKNIIAHLNSHLAKLDTMLTECKSVMNKRSTETYRCLPMHQPIQSRFLTG